MTWLVLGVLLFAAVHLLPTAPRARGFAVERLGLQPYKGLFSLAAIGGIALIAVGWRSTPPSPLYAPPGWGALAASPVAFVALLLFAASGVPSNLKRFVRHPQLSGVIAWAIAHLLANGDSRSLVLFGGIGLWAVLAMRLANRRDGAWQRPERLPLSAELKPLVAAAVVFAILFAAHPYIAGVSLLPR